MDKIIFEDAKGKPRKPYDFKGDVIQKVTEERIKNQNYRDANFSHEFAKQINFKPEAGRPYARIITAIHSSKNQTPKVDLASRSKAYNAFEAEKVGEVKRKK